MNIQDLLMYYGIPVNKIGPIGELSDGYHSFNDLYRQRCVLFAALCNTYPNLAWKSRKHHDGELCFGGGWFIVGIDTPEGQYTYHYEDRDWDMFKVPEWDWGKMWDGHTSEDVERVLSLTDIPAPQPKSYPVDELEEKFKKTKVGRRLVEAKHKRDAKLKKDEEESTMESWARKEIELACKRERDGAPEDEWDYGCACYESAYKAFKALCEDDHSGMSIGFTKNIINRLIDGKPLTPIEDTPDIWSDIIDRHDDYDTYQCKRMSSLFKDVYKDGTVKYNNVDAFVMVDIRNSTTWHSGLIDRLIGERYPITMPYSPGKQIRVYCEEYLTDHANGDFDTCGVLYLIDENGEKVDINRYFKDADTETGWEEINMWEYSKRKVQAKQLEKMDAAKTRSITK